MTTSTTGQTSTSADRTLPEHGDGLDVDPTADLTPGDEHGGNGLRPAPTAPEPVDPTEPTSPEPVEAALAVVRSYTDSTVPDISRADRVRSREVSDFPVPTGREEEWRFTPLARVREMFEAAEDASAVTVTVRWTTPP